MTTIAWDGLTLAADTLCVGGGGVKRYVHKLTECADYIYGGTGVLSDVIRIADWLRRGAPMHEAPELEEGGINGLAVDRARGRAYLVDGKRPVLSPVEEPFAASGSGRDFALAAMALGRTAREAVELAARFDVYTGGVVETLQLATADPARP